MNLLRFVSILISIGVFCVVLGTVVGQDSNPNDAAGSSTGLVDGAELANSDPGTIAQLREVGIPENVITWAIQEAQNAHSGMNASQVQMQWHRSEWYQWCQIDRWAHLYGGSGNGSLNIRLEFQPGRKRGPTALHRCNSGWCFFWHHGRLQGHWPWRFVLEGTAYRVKYV